MLRLQQNSHCYVVKLDYYFLRIELEQFQKFSKQQNLSFGLNNQTHLYSVQNVTLELLSLNLPYNTGS
ncbi:unnamed protein product [Schistosoma margrebowiei]|uniref:Uncharacterized protein n=1 Tax=Schistosoma margrebowiei TaxID=48269 RepID=A0A3P7XDW8_9TREM|nr:unnamed protein product [Schistosoma margrebowiei]